MCPTMGSRTTRPTRKKDVLSWTWSRIGILKRDMDHSDSVRVWPRDHLQIMKALGSQWKVLSEKERKKYVQRAQDGRFV
jgi:hypothetical protein